MRVDVAHSSRLRTSVARVRVAGSRKVQGRRPIDSVARIIAYVFAATDAALNHG
jgi:hypothetical protein